LRRQWVADHYDNNQQSTTFVEWCDDADDWGDNKSVVEEYGNSTVKSQEIKMCAAASAELENSDVDDNVVVEPIEIPNTNFLQLLDSRKEIPSVSFLINLDITCIKIKIKESEIHLTFSCNQAQRIV